jgi:hypothetical protein
MPGDEFFNRYATRKETAETELENDELLPADGAAELAMADLAKAGGHVEAAVFAMELEQGAGFGQSAHSFSFPAAAS